MTLLECYESLDSEPKAHVLAYEAEFIQKPPSATLEAVVLYDALIRACALAGMFDPKILKAVRGWVNHAGAEPYELAFMQGLIDANLDEA